MNRTHYLCSLFGCFLTLSMLAMHRHDLSNLTADEQEIAKKETVIAQSRTRQQIIKKELKALEGKINNGSRQKQEKLMEELQELQKAIDIAMTHMIALSIR